jgi:hypothetical protein
MSTSINIEITFLTTEQRNEASLLFAKSGGWQPLVDGEPNPITAEEFGIGMLATYLRQRVSERSAYEAQIAAAQAVTDLLTGVTVTQPPTSPE